MSSHEEHRAAEEYVARIGAAGRRLAARGWRLAVAEQIDLHGGAAWTGRIDHHGRTAALAEQRGDGGPVLLRWLGGDTSAGRPDAERPGRFRDLWEADLAEERIDEDDAVAGLDLAGGAAISVDRISGGRTAGGRWQVEGHIDYAGEFYPFRYTRDPVGAQGVLIEDSGTWVPFPVIAGRPLGRDVDHLWLCDAIRDAALEPVWAAARRAAREVLQRGAARYDVPPPAAAAPGRRAGEGRGRR